MYRVQKNGREKDQAEDPGGSRFGSYENSCLREEWNPAGKDREFFRTSGSPKMPKDGLFRLPVV